MNADCENRTRGGDCLTRNSRLLCDSCLDLLSDDELDSREVSFMVADYARKAQRQLAALKKPPKRCLTLRPNEDRSCLERGLVALCGYCITSMTTDELIAYATDIVKTRRESAEYWDDEAEAKEYAAELRARGVTGIEWNIECSLDSDSESMEAAYIVHSLFQFSKPCFIHAEESAA
jgi:hypothetical protein